MDDSHNGVKPPTITTSIARILFTTLSSTHDEDSIIMTCIAIQDYDYKELLTAIQDKEELKALAKIVEAKEKSLGSTVTAVSRMVNFTGTITVAAMATSC